MGRGGEFHPLDRPGMAGGQLFVAPAQRCAAILLETLALPPWFRKGATGETRGMHLILFLVGIIVAFAGAVLVLHAVPVLDVAAAALFCSGIVAIVGGLILIALAAAVRNL